MDMVDYKLEIFLLFVVFLLIGASEQQRPRVETGLGAIIGTERTSETGKKIYSFTGIPYIKPPVKELRFKPPVPVEPFLNDFEATNPWKICVQNVSGYYFGTEDCVILNVFSPWDPSSSLPEEPLSVMVYIHYGAFIAGSSISSVVGLPDYLLERDVILVTMNFRLGVLGFLSTADEEAPGNYGLLDIVEALKWIKNHIAAFGGNPDKVTIFGDNSGAVTTHYLMLSPLAKGLFHQVVVQSGSALAPSAKTDLSGKYSKLLAEKLNCSTFSSYELINCLRGKTIEELVKTDLIEKEERLNDYYPVVWAPRIDPEADSPFLPQHPIRLMESGNYNKVPLLIGHTKDEYFSEMYGPSKENYKAALENNGFLDLCKKYMLFIEDEESEEKTGHLCKLMHEHYFKNNENTTKDIRLILGEIGSDANVMAGIYKSIELMADQSPVYSYSFNYDNGETWLLQLLTSQYQYTKGFVPHMDDLLFLFKYSKTNWTTESPQYQMVETMTKAWTEFAKTGEPVLPTLKEPWPRATSKNSKYVVIDSVPTIEESYRPEDMEFVNNIYSQSLYKDSIELSVATTSSYLNQILIMSTIFLVMLLQ